MNHYNVSLFIAALKSLQTKLPINPFREDVVLSVKSLPPSQSILMTSEQTLCLFDIKHYCGKYCGTCDLLVEKKTDKNYIVTFSSQIG